MVKAGAPDGYSGKPLADKLGLADGQAVLFVDLPAPLMPLAATRAFGRVEHRRFGEDVPAGGPFHVVCLFAVSRRPIADELAVLPDVIEKNGMIWVMWPKASSKVATDVNEDVIRAIALPLGLVDTKVCAVDAIWSGLKLVIRKENR
jgi:hypothetical protein